MPRLAGESEAKIYTPPDDLQNHSSSALENIGDQTKMEEGIEKKQEVADESADMAGEGAAVETVEV